MGYKTAAVASQYNHIAKDKLDSITEECDSNDKWLSELEERQSTKHKWDEPVFSMSELTLRTQNLVKNATKILSEPRPKKEDKKEKKDDKKEKTEGDSVTEPGKAAEDAAASSGESATPTTSADPPKKRWTMWLKWALVAVVVTGGGALLGGYGERY